MILSFSIKKKYLAANFIIKFQSVVYKRKVYYNIVFSTKTLSTQFSVLRFATFQPKSVDTIFILRKWGCRSCKLQWSLVSRIVIWYCEILVWKASGYTHKAYYTSLRLRLSTTILILIPEPNRKRKIKDFTSSISFDSISNPSIVIELKINFICLSLLCRLGTLQCFENRLNSSYWNLNNNY